MVDVVALVAAVAPGRAGSGSAVAAWVALVVLVVERAAAAQSIEIGQAEVVDAEVGAGAEPHAVTEATPERVEAAAASVVELVARRAEVELAVAVAVVVAVEAGVEVEVEVEVDFGTASAGSEVLEPGAGTGAEAATGFDTGSVHTVAELVAAVELVVGR